MNSFVELKYFKKEKNMFGMKMKVKTEKMEVLLRPIGKQDIEVITRNFDSMRVHMYTKGLFAQTYENELEWYENNRTDPTSCTWGIQPEGSGEVVGITSLHKINSRNGDSTSGIIIFNTDWWGKGVASAAHLARTMFATDFLNRHIIKSIVRVKNKASKRALERVGYTVSGIEPLDGYRAAEWIDSYRLIWIHPERLNFLYPKGLPKKYKKGVERASVALEKARSVVEFL